MVKIFKRFYRFLFNYKKAFFAFLLVMVVAAVLESVNPYIYKLLIDALPEKNYDLLVSLLIIYIGVRLAANLTNTLSYYLGDKVLIPASLDARISVFRRVQELDFAFHVNKNTGSLISAFKRGDSAFFELFHNLHHEISHILINLAIALFFFSRINYLIALLLIATFILNAVLSWFLIKKNIKTRYEFNVSEDRVSGIITDNLINYETVKFFAQEGKEEKRLKSEFIDWSGRLWKYANSFRLMDICIGSLANLGSLLILWIVIRGVTIGSYGIGDFVLVLSFMSGFYYQFFNLLYKMRNIAKHYTDISRYFSILDESVLVKDPEQPVKAKQINGKIEFRNVTFVYPDSPKKQILKHFDLTINPGESVAFVGRSGAGKTTIVKLLLRFYDVSKGEILIDGIKLPDFTKNQLRSFIGLVPQEPILFNNTIGFNIAYGSAHTTRKNIINAAKEANLHDFIDGLPRKYNTEVGERGIKLSGGQKQRLAIARMLIINPKIIIFDEATSNLDSESERLIQESLWNIARDRTILIIAHRFSTVQRASKIVVLEKGEMVESGSHQDLIKNKKGLYQYLWQLQSKADQHYDPDLLR